MGKESYLSLIIFCAVLLQALAVLSGVNIEESSNLLIRKKRVIDKTRNGGLPIQLSRAPYIVNILKNGRSHCAGAILEADIIITTRLCVAEIPGVTFTILSNSALRNNGTPHHIVRRSSNPGFGFVLVKIFPPIELHHRHNGKIDLFLGVVPLHAYAYFSGWGCTSPNYKNKFPEQLMQTKLPLITHQECNRLYDGHGPDEDHNICTFDESRRRAACEGDEGGPLVYDNRLLGILFFTGWISWEHPNIFINFNRLEMHNMVNFNMNALRDVQ